MSSKQFPFMFHGAVREGVRCPDSAVTSVVNDDTTGELEVLGFAEKVGI